MRRLGLILLAGALMVTVGTVPALAAGPAPGPTPGNRVGVSASLDRTQIGLDQAARLTVTVDGAMEATQPSIPWIEGLRVRYAGQSSRHQMVNGVVSASVSYVYLVQAERSGSYRIPALQVNAGGRTLATEPLALDVSNSNSSSGAGAWRTASPRQPAARSGRPSVPSTAWAPSPVPSARDPEPEAADGAAAFLTVTPLSEKPYVGQLVPVVIKAYFRGGLRASLNALPALNGSAFTLQNPSREPERGQEQVNGTLYTTLTWNTAFSAVKEGSYPLGAHLAVTLMIPDRSARTRSPFGSFFGNDDFFDDDFFSGFFGRMQEKAVTLQSRETPLAIRSLPETNRPADFHGAVGRFHLTARAEPRQVAVGDPITLTLEVSGTGSFDRVQKPRLASEEGWKLYPASARFEPHDAVGVRGVKRYEQAIIPGDAGITAIPAVRFTYFDTARDDYVTLDTEPIAVTVRVATGSATARATTTPNPAPSLSGLARSGSNTAPAVETEGGLAPLHIEPGPRVASYRPWLEQAWFPAACAGPLGLMAAGWWLIRRNRRRATHPELAGRARARRAVHDALKAMDRAVVESDPPAFFEACRRAAQVELGQRWNQSPDAITLAEVRTRLPAANQGIRGVFEQADAVAYAGEAMSQDEMSRWKHVLEDELKQLKVEV